MTRKYQGRTALRGQVTVKFEQKDYDRIERTARCRGVSLAQQVRDWAISGMWSSGSPPQSVVKQAAGARSGRGLITLA